MGWANAITLLFAAAVVVVPAGTRGEPGARERGNLAVLAFGRCDEPRLADATRAVRGELKVRGGLDVLDEQATAAPAGPLAQSSEDEVLRAIDSGKTEFLNLNVTRAEKTLRAVLPDIDRLPLGPRRWEAWWRARVHLARLLQYSEQRTRASEVFLEILRVQEDFTLNRFEFPPSTRDLLELSRAMLAGLPRHRLTVTTPKPGATVFINGLAAGPTPFERRMVAGTYQIVVGDPARPSFERRVPMSADVSLEVDVEREARFRPGLGPCYEAGENRAERLTAAASLAAMLGADQIVAVRIERLGAEEYLAAALIEVARGREVREGRVRLEGSAAGVDRLAQFVLTGEGLPGQLAAPLSATQAPAVEDEISDGGTWTRVAAWSLAGAAALLGGVAVYEHLEAGSIESDIQGLVVPGTQAIEAKNQDRYDALQSDLDSARGTRTGCAIAAAAAAVGSGVLFFVSAGPEPSGDGTAGVQASLMVAGTF